MRWDVWVLVRFLHIGSAILWVGGQLTLSLLVRPVAARLFDEGTRVDLVMRLGRRFGRIAALGLIPLLLASGLALIFHRGVTLRGLTTPGYGVTLTVKVILAFVSFALVALHGMTAVRSSPKRARVIGMVGAAVSLAVVLLAVSLVP